MESIESAWKNQIPVKIAFGRKPIYQYTKNRSFPAYLRNQDIHRNITKEQAINPWIEMIRIDTWEGKPYIVFTNFSIHPTVIPETNFFYHRDVFGYIEKGLEDYVKKEFHVNTFVHSALNYTHGDSTPNYDDENEEGDFLIAKEIGYGICGSDLHLLHGFLKPAFSPIIPGHEASGIVEEIGDEVRKVKKGDHVVISAGTSCGECEFCKNQKENLCEKVGVLGFHRNGAMAEYICVEERNVFKISSDIPFTEAAILPDAVSTPFYAIKTIGNFQENQNIGVIGCDGLGIHAIKIAKGIKANQIYAFDILESSLQNAKKAGATEIFNSHSLRDIIKSLHKKIYFHLILDFTGIYDFIEPMLRLLYSGGKYILVGLSRNKLKIKIPSLITFRTLSLQGSYGTDSHTFQELIDFYNHKKIHLEDSISGTFPLYKINECIKDLEERNHSLIRYVLKPHESKNQ